MAIKFMDGLDLYASNADAEKIYTDIDAWDITNGKGRFGGNAFTVTDAAVEEIRIELDTTQDITTIIVGFAFFIEAAASSVDQNFIAVDDLNGTDIFRIKGNGAGGADVRDVNNNTVATFDLPSFGSWSYLELKVEMADQGQAEVKINGVTVASITSGNFDSNERTIRRVKIINIARGAEVRIDDIIIMDQTGSVNNDFVGEVKISALTVSGAGSNSDFSSTETNNYEAVDEASGSDGDTTYNSSKTSGDRDSFSLTDLPETPDTIVGMKTQISARKDDLGLRSYRPVLITGTTTDLGSELALGNGYGLDIKFYETNPDTGAAWTEAEINAVEVGYEIP